jgi:hypothetical protein
MSKAPNDIYSSNEEMFVTLKEIENVIRKIK